MATNTATANKPAPAAPANAPAPATLTGPNVTATALHAFVNGQAGGNAHKVQIVCLPNVTPTAANPLPFTNMQKQGKRAAIMWAIVNGVPMPNGQPASRTLAAFMAFAGKQGASQRNPLDLLAALNGGFSESSKTWGTPFIKLVVTQ